MKMLDEDGRVCTRCEVFLYDEFAGAGGCVRCWWEGDKLPTQQDIHQDTTDWSEDEVIDVVASMLSITQGKELIQVNWM